jgi:predicted nucleic acid-binding protein
MGSAKTMVVHKHFRLDGAKLKRAQKLLHAGWCWKSSMQGRMRRAARLIEKLERDFERARRVLVPNLSDWTQTGRILAKVGAKYGFERIGQGRLTNDALIATSAARCGIEVITVNARDFARLAEFCPLQWRVG